MKYKNVHKNNLLHKKNSSGFIQRRLDYIIISNTLQEFVTMTEILTPISTDHTPILLCFSEERGCLRGNRIWKCNCSLTKDQDYITEILKNDLQFLYCKYVSLQPSTKMVTVKI